MVELTKTDKPFKWTDWQDKAFADLKQLLCSPPILAYPRLEEAYILDTHASDYGIGTVLSQVQDGEEQVIAYASKVLNDAQWYYCTTKKKLYAAVYLVKHFHHYLLKDDSC